MFDDDFSWKEAEEKEVLVDSRGMTPRQANLLQIDAIAKVYGYTVEDILGKSKLKALVAVRRQCVNMLHEKGYSTTEIGRIMNRDHSTICHALKMWERDALAALALHELQGRKHDT
jgi:chromosomal replication initiation ATPase DnaA